MPAIDKNQLLPYLEDALDPAQQAKITAYLAADPALASDVKRLRRTVDSLRRAAARAPSAQAASHWPTLYARLILTPAPRRTPAWAASGAALAALASAALAIFWLPQHSAHRAVRVAAPIPVQTPLRYAPAVIATHQTAKVRHLSNAPIPKAAAGPEIRRDAPVPPAVLPKPLPPVPPLPAPPLRTAQKQKPALPRQPAEPLLSAAGPTAGRRKAAAMRMMLLSKNITPRLAGPDLTPPAALLSPAGPAPTVPSTPQPIGTAPQSKH